MYVKHCPFKRFNSLLNASWKKLSWIQVLNHDVSLKAATEKQRLDLHKQIANINNSNADVN